MTDPELTDPDLIEDVSTEDVSTEDANAAWAVAAREQLTQTARRYHHVITVKELAAAVVERTGITTERRPSLWMDDVLGIVAADCARRGEPNLTSLCVNAAGSVGGGYASAVASTTGATPENPDGHAAVARLECHSYFEAPGLPAGGGVPMLTPRLSDARSRERKASLAARPVESCPRCFMVMPTEGPCNNCE